jgi:hypothetical protein
VAAGWSYGPDFYPAGDEIFVTGAESNPGGYSNTENDLNFLMTEPRTSKTAMYTCQDYVARQFPVIWEPNPPEAGHDAVLHAWRGEWDAIGEDNHS